ncbi:hypothetical protein D9758_012510 [Tetrapyrgos nigripes]|uniref:Lysine-specific metallo-endopeptidase domain-containing protein n=1 Tax=Tetrapyrgos nigripes TaxID=182062 RepID=A0A8H5G382_9AGAR|nr:hypothetical protein D9758_012510 [Tetrapyrgos nigripes]
MLSSTKLHSFASALIIYALSASATQELTLKLTGTEIADGVDNLKVVASLSNTGDETLQVLNDPRSILSSHPTNSFSISDADGAAPSFNGMKVKYSPSFAARKNYTNAFTTLTPGQSVEVEHDLSNAYNFTQSGASRYNIIPASTFYIYDLQTQEVSKLKAKIQGEHSSKLHGRLAVSRRSFAKRCDDDHDDDEEPTGPAFQKCNHKQRRQIRRAVQVATKYAHNAHDYLTDHTNATDRYETWFGEYNKTRHRTVTKHYANLVEQGYKNYTYDCGTCDDNGTFAYVYTEPDAFGTIYLCGAFWRANATGTDSRGGTLVHESTHFTKLAGTADHVYGQSGAKDLAKEDPDEAITNADTHEYFAENHPALD